MRHLLAACLATASIVASAAAQPAPRQVQVAPGVATAQQLASQSADIAGSWDVLPLPPGRLTLSPGANGVLTGTLDTSGGAAPCMGQWRGSQFVIQCRMSSAAVIFSAKAVQDPPVATQRRALGPGTTALGNNRRLVGKQSFCGLGLSGQEAPNCLEVPLTGTPAS